VLLPCEAGSSLCDDGVDALPFLLQPRRGNRAMTATYGESSRPIASALASFRAGPRGSSPEWSVTNGTRPCTYRTCAGCTVACERHWLYDSRQTLNDGLGSGTIKVGREIRWGARTGRTATLATDWPRGSGQTWLSMPLDTKLNHSEKREKVRYFA
jgi:hypothetical protein